MLDESIYDAARRFSDAARTAPQRFARPVVRVAGGLSSRYCSTRFGELHYYDSDPGGGGRGVVLCVHGLGAIGLTLAPLASHLRAHRRVILPDLFDFGGLSKGSGRALDSHEHVRALLDLVDHLGVASVDIAGHSVGGAASIWFSVFAPERTRSLSLFNPGGVRLGFSRLKRRCLDFVSGERAEQLFVRTVGRGLVTPSLRAMGGRVVRETFRHAGVCDYLESIRAHHYVDDVLRDVACPTLLLWGDRDTFLPAETAVQIVREIPQVEGYWVENGTHVLPIEAPLTVARALLAFWRVEPEVRSWQRLAGRLATRRALVRIEPAPRAPHGARA